MKLWELEEPRRPNLKDGRLSKFGFRRDNPGGEWLERKQAASFQRKDKCQGAITAWFDEPLLLPAKWLHYIPGAMGEDHKPGTPKFDALLAQVQEVGFNLSPRMSGLMGINHEGQAFILEGNTRAAVATHLGIESIPFEVRYWNGGEEVLGDFDPVVICDMADLNTNPR